MEKKSISKTLKEILCSILEHENFEIKNELKA